MYKCNIFILISITIFLNLYNKVILFSDITLFVNIIIIGEKIWITRL